MDKEIYQKQYDFELEQRLAIASSTNTPIVALTIIGGAASSMVLGYPYSVNNYTVAFCFFIAGCIIAILVALIYIFKSLLGYSYQKISSVIALSNHYSELKQWHKNNGETETVSIELADKDYAEYLYQKLSEAAENNGNNNLRRGNFIHDAMVSIAISLAFLIVSVPFFIYEKINNNVEVHQVEIIKPLKLIGEKIIMSENQESGNNSNTSSSSSQTEPAAAPAQPKPSGPANPVFKGSVEIGENASNPINVDKGRKK